MHRFGGLSCVLGFLKWEVGGTCVARHACAHPRHGALACRACVRGEQRLMKNVTVRGSENLERGCHTNTWSQTDEDIARVASSHTSKGQVILSHTQSILLQRLLTLPTWPTTLVYQVPTLLAVIILLLKFKLPTKLQGSKLLLIYLAI